MKFIQSILFLFVQLCVNRPSEFSTYVGKISLTEADLTRIAV